MKYVNDLLKSELFHLIWACYDEMTNKHIYIHSSTNISSDLSNY